MNPRAPHGQQGFSLIEMILFIVVIGILSVAFMKAITGGLSDPDLPRKMTQAAMLVQEKVEEIYYDSTQQTLDLSTMPSYATESPVDAALFPDFSRTVSYAPITKGSAIANYPGCPSSSTGDCRVYTVQVKDRTNATTVYAQADIYLVK